MNKLKDKILEVKNLKTHFFALDGIVQAVRGVDFYLNNQEILGIVGESGSGKSVSCLSILQLVPPPGKIVSGEILVQGKDILKKNENWIRNNIRGKQISMIFQDPSSALNPTRTIGWQMTEALSIHSNEKIRMDDVKDKLIDALDNMDMPDPESILYKYPHQLSGGMKQRIIIAIALLLNAKILIADEPTTSLDVTIQLKVLDIISRLKEEFGLSVILISHDLNVIIERCDRTVVMYGGIIVESAESRKILENPLCPYTYALIKCIPPLHKDAGSFEPIPGDVVDLLNPPIGCPFYPRCDRGDDKCKDNLPDLIEIEEGHKVRCFYPMNKVVK